jgi:hypothetical protein
MRLQVRRPSNGSTQELKVCQDAAAAIGALNQRGREFGCHVCRRSHANRNGFTLGQVDSPPQSCGSLLELGEGIADISKRPGQNAIIQVEDGEVD